MALYAVHERRAPRAVGVSRPWKTSAIARALAIPRRAHARRSCEHAFAYRKNRFLPADARTATRSGGRKPPVVSQTRLQVRFQHVAATFARRLHGGLTVAAHVRACGDEVPMWGESLLRRPYRDHGGLTPAALVRACGDDVPVRGESLLR